MDLAETKRMALINKPKDNRNLMVGLDIGTSKIVAIVAEPKPDGGFEVVGMGSHPSRGLKKGVVVNIDSTVNAIQRALEEAELMADCKIKRGLHRHRRQPHQELQLARHGGGQGSSEVSQQDVDRVIETAKAVNIPTDQQILHVLNQEFIIDGQEDVREPLGMAGVRLEVQGAHRHRCRIGGAEHSSSACAAAGSKCATSSCSRSPRRWRRCPRTKRISASAMVDIGGGTTDIAVFTQGAIRHTAVIPIAGDQITNDIAMALAHAHQGRRGHQAQVSAARCASSPNANEMVEVPGVGDRGSRQLSRQTLAEVIEPRVEELYSLVQAELRRSGYEDLLSSGIVITGGSAGMQGMVELGEEVFHMPVRLGVPQLSGPARRGGARAALLDRASGCSWPARRAAEAAGSGEALHGKHAAGFGADEGMVHGQFLRKRGRNRDRVEVNGLRNFTARKGGKHAIRDRRFAAPGSGHQGDRCRRVRRQCGRSHDRAAASRALSSSA